MRDLLFESDIAKDWVARNEINERLLAAESELRLEMSKKGGVKFSWNGEGSAQVARARSVHGLRHGVPYLSTIACPTR